MSIDPKQHDTLAETRLGRLSIWLLAQMSNLLHIQNYCCRRTNEMLLMVRRIIPYPNPNSTHYFSCSIRKGTQMPLL